MHVNELENIASRLHNICRNAIAYGQHRLRILDLIEEFANELQNEADYIAKEMAKSNGPHETDLWYDTSKELV